MRKLLVLFLAGFWCPSFGTDKSTLEDLPIDHGSSTSLTENVKTCTTQQSEAVEVNGPVSYLTNLFNTSNYPARWNCGYWSDFEGWFYIISDFSIFSAYVSIPIILLFIFFKKKWDVPFKNNLILFAIFILFCGFTHLIETILFWEPIYRFSGIVKFLTGIVSWVTVVSLGQTLPFALTFRSPIELKAEIEQRKKAEKNLKYINEELDSFTYSVSHDLRAPLRAISGYSAILKEDYAEKLDNDGNNYLERILVNTSKMGVLIDDLLTFSRLNRKDTEYRRFSSAEMIRSTVDLTPEFKEIEADYNSLPEIYGDESMIMQVLQNLLSNAVKYSSKEQNPRIEIWGIENEKETIISVKDNGVGFDTQYGDKLFEVFQRLHGDDEFEGNGIGLALSKKIIDKHDGQITFQSKEGEGSTFNIILPKTLKNDT